MIASGLPLAARPASVTDSASARAKLAVCSKMIWYLSFMRSSTLCTPLLRSIAGPAPGWPCRWNSLAPFGNAATMACASASPPLTLSAPTWARMPSTPSTRRSMVTTGTPACTACSMAGASALTSSGEMTMALTFCTIAASMSAVCLGAEFWPSLSIRLTPCASASTLIWLSMCTKNGKLEAGHRAEDGQLVLGECARRGRPPARRRPRTKSRTHVCSLGYSSSLGSRSAAIVILLLFSASRPKLANAKRLRKATT